MGKPVWHPVRLSLLALTFTGAALVAAKAIVTPKTSNSPVVNYAPPETVPLPNWQQSPDTALIKAESGEAVGRRYEYRQPNLPPLTIETRREVGEGNVSRYLFVFSPVREGNVKMQSRYRAGVGHYGVLTHKNSAYLTACVNPRGESSVSERQFMQNRYQHDLSPGRILPWVLGQQPLFDQRCLWTLMSMPLDPKLSPVTASEAAFQTMESAWVPWHEWWQKNFPAN